MESRSPKHEPPVVERQVMPAGPGDNLLQDLDKEESMDKRLKKPKVIFIVYAILIVFGVLTGYLLSKQSASQASTAPAVVKEGKTVGITDIQTFKDSAEGTIEKGGIEGEGSHKLIRQGGPSQTAALVSSVVDLDQYVGKKVKVWGQTYAAKKAAWFMDVGKIELLE